MQTDMAIRINVDDREYLIALRDKLSGQRAGAVRQIQQDPLVVPLFFQALQRKRELRKQALIRGFILAFLGGQLTKRQQIKLGGVAHTCVPPVFVIQ